MNQDQIEDALAERGLSNADMAVHSSLRAFGHVDGGAKSVVSALLNVGRNVMMPTFCQIGRTNPPPDDRPLQNGWDYESYRIDSADFTAFDPEAFGIESEINVSEMGQIPKALLQATGSVRSMHPSVSWCCNGPDAEWLMADHFPDNPNLPLKRLATFPGRVLLLGVDLRSCTALHLAEEVTGRRPFIRWVKCSDGSIRRVREYGCSDGFQNLKADLADVLSEFTIGKCPAILASLPDLVEKGAELINAHPERTICRLGGSCRCKDSAKGGPIEHAAGQQDAQPDAFGTD